MLFYHVPPTDHLSLSKCPQNLLSLYGKLSNGYVNPAGRMIFFSAAHDSEDRIPSCLEQPLGKLKGHPFAAPELKFQIAFPWHSSAEIDKSDTGLSLLLPYVLIHNLLLGYQICNNLKPLGMVHELSGMNT